MGAQYIIASADKSVLRISGLEIKGLNTEQIEKILSDKLNSLVRVIGVTGREIEMDIYGLEPEQISKNEKGLIDALALMDGVTVTELTKLSSNEKIIDVEYSRIPDEHLSPCAKERWMMYK